MPQKDQSGLVSVADFVRGVREQADAQGVDLGDMSDDDVYAQVAKVDPTIVKGVVEPRRPMKEPKSEDGMASRFAQGMAAVPNAAISAPFKSETYKGMGQAFTKQLMSMVGSESTRKQMTEKMEGESKAAGGASQLVDAPNIKKDWQSDNKMGAAGRTTTQALMAGSMLKGMMPAAKAGEALPEMEAIGENTAKDPYMSIAKTMTKPQSLMLDKQMASIQEGMTNQFIDSQKLGADAAYAKGVVSKLKNVPDAQLRQVNAARDAIAQLSQKMKANPKLMPWNDAFSTLKNIKQAKRAFGPGPARDAMEEIQKGLEDRLQATADAAGQGEAFKKWNADYTKLSRMQRAGAKIMKQQTAQQKTTALTAKEGMRIGTRRLGIQIGESRAGKIAQTNKEMLDKWHKGLKELDSQIQTAPAKARPMAGGAVEGASEEARRRGMPQQNPAGQMPNMAKPPEEPF